MQNENDVKCLFLSGLTWRNESCFLSIREISDRMLVLYPVEELEPANLNGLFLLLLVMERF